MPPNPPRTSDEMLYVDQDHPLADFTFDSALGWYQSPAPYRVLIVLERSIRPTDLRKGMQLAARLSWEVVHGNAGATCGCCAWWRQHSLKLISQLLAR